MAAASTASPGAPPSARASARARAGAMPVSRLRRSGGRAAGAFHYRRALRSDGWMAMGGDGTVINCWPKDPHTGELGSNLANLGQIWQTVGQDLANVNDKIWAKIGKRLGNFGARRVRRG